MGVVYDVSEYYWEGPSGVSQGGRLVGTLELSSDVYVDVSPGVCDGVCPMI